MKKFILIFSVMVLSASWASSAFAETTVTVDSNEEVTINRRQPETVTVVQAAPTTYVQTVPAAVVVQPVIYTRSEDPRDLEGEIIRVDYTGNQIVVQDVDGREHRVDMKQGMVGNYKVGDYVKIYLMADMREAKTISTQHTADVEGNIVGIDYTNGRVIVHDRAGVDRVVIFKPGTINNYKTGDHVRLYVVSDYYPGMQEARMIRVK